MQSQTLLIHAALYLWALTSFAVASRPNIVWIFSDDHSYQTIGAYGGHLQELNPTPNIDRLAGQGMRFDRCFVENSICSPSRATLLTGKFSHMHKKYGNHGRYNHDQQQFQKVLQQNGYQTALIGKIHLDGKMQGFDYWEVLSGQGRYENPTLFSEDGEKQYEGYTTDIITGKALAWLETKRDPNKPFMLMIHNKAPHRNWLPKREHMDKYADVTIPEPATLFDDYATRPAAAPVQSMTIAKHMTLYSDVKLVKNKKNAASLDDRFDKRRAVFAQNKPTGKGLTRLKYQYYLKDYLRCIWSVDENIGRVLDYLEKSGLDQNTVVMYASDQGFYMGEHGWFDKRFMYEESFRTPLIVRWPGTTTPGSVNTDLAQNVDWAPTFLDIAGAPIPDEMQGKSLVPLLKGETPKDWRTSLYYHYYDYPGGHSVRRHEGVRDARYKLIRFYGVNVPDGESWEFFDLDKDPKELNNGYNNPEYAGRIATMKKELARLKDQHQVPADPPSQGKRGKSTQKKSKAAAR